MNMEVVTIEDCLDMCDMKESYVILNDGQVIGFKNEKIAPTDLEIKECYQATKCVTL